MKSFLGGRLRNLVLPQVSISLLTDIAEAKGLQQLYVRQAPQVLRALRETALVQSVESSNRIEGVTVAPERLRLLVVGNARPRDRSEEEIRGYRRALELIHTHSGDLRIAPELMQRIHRTIQDGSPDAGRWKHVDNEIVELRPGAAPRVRFRPVPAAATPRAIADLCRSYHHAIDQEHVQPLVAVAAFVLDFLCIHPFRDGNGRVSRLFAHLALYQHGFEVGRYVSLERLVEESRGEYYDALAKSSRRWHGGKHDLLPWLDHFLTVLRRAYRLFAQNALASHARGGKTALVETAIEALPESFTFTDLMRTCSGVSRDMIRRVLRANQAMGRVVCEGRGPGARWRKKKR